MNERRLCVFLVMLVVVVALPSIASALQIDVQWPSMSTWEHRTYWPVSLTFNTSLNTATVTNDSFWLAPDGQPDEKVPGVISFETTNIANDTVVFTPDDPWRLGLHYRFNVTDDVESFIGVPFDGNFPEGGDFVANVSADFERNPYDPLDPISQFVNANVLVGFDIIDPESTDPDKPWTIPGMGATEAWKFTTGRPEVIIAVIDNGLALYNNREIADRCFLNQGELLMPQDGSVLCDDWDCNGDGRFSASDYANDPRVPDPPATYPISPGELIEAFADGLDNDGNGYTDDISGFDFMRWRPEAVGIDEWPEGAHGDDRSKDACAIAGNDYGSKPGFCPDCTLLPVRVSDAIMASHNSVALGVRYAMEMGAQVGIAASGTPDYSWDNEELIIEAYENGLLLVAAAGDELGFHHSYPAAGETVFSVKSIFPIPNLDFYGIFPMDLVAFTETYCTNYNEHVHSAGASGACSSEATGNTGGAAGLLLSRAMDLGIDLSPGEIKQLITMTSDDIHNRCVSLTGGGCQPGFDRHFGYGRPNLLRAMEALGDGVDHRIPPDVLIIEPRWWTVFDPTTTPEIDIEATIYARGEAFTYEVQIARGPEPLEAEFFTIATGSGQDAIDDVIATFSPYDVFTEEEMRARPVDPDDFTFTVRVQATRNAKDGPVMGEDRKAFAAHIDNDADTGLLPGLPYDVLASGESSPVLYDLDGKDGGKLELIFGTTDGNLEVFGWDEENQRWAPWPGFPVNVRDNEYRQRDTALAPPAVGDMFGNGQPIIIVACGGGALYAVWPDGNLHTNDQGQSDPFLPGFPYLAAEPDRSTPKSFGHGNTFAAAPVLCDLDNDGMLEIIAASFDAHVYAIKPVDQDNSGMVDDVAGFPVLLQSLPDTVPAGKVCYDEDGNAPEGVQILGTPAVGVMYPDSDDPELSESPVIIVPTTEVCVEPEPIDFWKTGRLYAIRHDGNATHDSPFIEGWPLKLPAPLADALPIPPLTTGITAAPAIAYQDGKTLVGTGAFAYLPIVIELVEGVPPRMVHMRSELSINASGHGAFGPLEPDGPLHYALPTLSAIKIVDGWISLLRPLLMAWDLTSITDKPAVSTDMEDIHFYASPAIADIDGDGGNEVIAGSSGFVLHALSPDGSEPEGWPKFTFNWIISSVAAGDADNDGGLELFVPTHEGRLLGWNTTGPACVNGKLNAPWRRFHHDEYNSGVYGTDTIPPGVPLGLVKEEGNNGTINLSWNAPGGDWYCGQADYYEVRVGNDAEELLTPDGFAAAQVVNGAPNPTFAGKRQTMKVAGHSLTQHFAVRAVDENGHIGHIAVTEMPSDDDDATSDDDTVDDDDQSPTDDDDNDDDDGCGC